MHLSLINSKGIKGSVTVVEGVNAAEKIIELIRRDRPYLVVIASKRLKLRGSLAKLRMLESIARRLSEESASPVLIVK
jgi:nucleotide-binding universal stress UspA family protein